MQKKIGLALIILMLAGIMAIPFLVKNNQAAHQKVKKEVVNDAQVNLNLFEASQISRIEIKDENMLMLEKRDNLWTDANYESLKLDHAAVEAIVQAAAALESLQVIYNVQEEEKYGFNDTSRIITLYDAENNNYTLRLGNHAEDQSRLFIGTDLAETLYIVKSDAAKALFQTRGDLIQKEMIRPAAGEIFDLKVAKKSEPLIHIQKNSETGTKDHEEWLLEGFFKNVHELRGEAVEELFRILDECKKEEFVGEADNLMQYGLDDPDLIITINDSWVVKFGMRNGEKVYFMYNEEPYVYKTSKAFLKEIEEIKPIAMIRKQVYIPDVSKLNKIVLLNPEKELELVVTKEILTDGTVQLQGEMTDKIFDDLKTKEIITRIAESIMIEAVLQNPEIEQKQPRKEEIRLVYHYEEGVTKTIDLVPYDNSFYILRMDDTVEFAVNKAKIMELFSALNEEIKE